MVEILEINIENTFETKGLNWEFRYNQETKALDIKLIEKENQTMNTTHIKTDHPGFQGYNKYFS